MRDQKAVAQESSAGSYPDAEFIGRLFRRFAAVYGTAKMAAMWDGQDPQEVKAVWADMLTPFPQSTILQAMGRLPPSSWPPSCLEFRAICSSLKGAIPQRKAEEPPISEEHQKNLSKSIAATREMAVKLGLLKRRNS